MLSIEDIYREIGKNIFICPLNTDNFRDNSVDLTASEFAWTSDGQYICNGEKITIPKHKTACILTNEAVYVSSKIGGTYHSRVSLVKKGLGHIGTMLDPKYCGQSLIMLHNISDNPVVIKVGERLVSLVFYYLKTSIGENILSTPPSHSEKIAELDKEQLYSRWCNDNKWANNPALLKAHFKENYSESFAQKRKIYAQRKGLIKRIFSSQAGKLIAKYLIILILVGALLLAIRYWLTPAQPDNWAGIIIPIFTCVLGMIASDITNKK